MKAFIEWIWEPTIIVRSGKDCDEYGKPFDYAVAAVIPWRQFFRWMCGGRARVVVKGLVSSNTMTLAEKQAHFRAGIAALSEFDLEHEYERIR